MVFFFLEIGKKLVILFFIGWYSSGSFIVAKTIVELTRLSLTMMVFCWIINKHGTTKLNLAYLLLWMFAVVCCQSVGQIAVVLLPRNAKLALFTGILVQLSMNMYSNHLIPVRHLHYSLQMVSEFTYTRMIWECLMLSMYSDCGSGRISLPLNLFDLKGDEYYPNLIRLLFIAIFSQLLSVTVYIFRSNPSSSNCYNNQAHKKTSSIGLSK